jgi:hypothetical protein
LGCKQTPHKEREREREMMFLDAWGRMGVRAGCMYLLDNSLPLPFQTVAWSSSFVIQNGPYLRLVRLRKPRALAKEISKYAGIDFYFYCIKKNFVFASAMGGLVVMRILY